MSISFSAGEIFEMACRMERNGARFYRNAAKAARDEVTEQAHVAATVIGSSTIVTTGLSVGYVLWLARGGLLLASLLSTMPAWRVIDPLPVLAGFRNSDDENDDESLESLVKKGAKKKPATAPEAGAEEPKAKQ